MARAWLLAPWGAQPLREPQPLLAIPFTPRAWFPCAFSGYAPAYVRSRFPRVLRSRLRAVEIPACPSKIEIAAPSYRLDGRILHTIGPFPLYDIFKLV